MKRMSSFPEFDFESTYISELKTSDQLIYHVAVPSSTTKEPRPDDAHFWSDASSDELLHEAAT